MLTAKNARQISSEFMDREEILMKRLQVFTKQSSVAQSLSNETIRLAVYNCRETFKHGYRASSKTQRKIFDFIKSNIT